LYRTDGRRRARRVAADAVTRGGEVVTAAQFALLLLCVSGLGLLFIVLCVGIGLAVGVVVSWWER
jgi:hypothetical protein